MKSKDMVIVESPTKAKTISRILGGDFKVVSSMGHLIDLPKKKIGIDVENNFEPTYVVISGRQKFLTGLKKEGKSKKRIFVATDPDREGEAIGWQIKERIFKDKEVLRVVFHEITPSAVKEAFKHARKFDLNMIEAQAGRRILDRIVGYLLSPLLWKKIVRGLSAGRVQSVALRVIIERERQIQEFVPKEYWDIEAELQKKKDTVRFLAKLCKIKGKKAEIKNKLQADELTAKLRDLSFVVSQVQTKEQKRYPAPPFITSTLQQDAFNKLKFNATKTMIVAQQLYEGIDVGEVNPIGLITYMRTDSVRAAPEAIKEVREFIVKKFGKKYLPDSPNHYKSKKHAQEAHEAIRPASMDHSPESLTTFLSTEQYKLYELIYNRFLASQMNPARLSVVSADIKAGDCNFSASGSTPLFDGFAAAYSKDNAQETKQKNVLPELTKDEILDLIEIIPSQHFTKSPPRFSDSSLVKILEEQGIGRPSTYAPIIYTLTLRDYVRRVKGYFHPTELGFKVCDLLVEYFPKVMDVKFTALMEEELDGIEEGKFDKLKVLQEFYGPFKENLDYAQENIKKEVITTDQNCQLCGKVMIEKWGRRGKFLSCSDYPTCKFSKSITSGVKCPEPECGGELIERRSRRGFFYGCSNFPKCRYTSKTLPEEKTEEQDS